MKITENRNLQILQILYSSIFCTFENENYKKSYSTSFVDLKEFNLEKNSTIRFGNLYDGQLQRKKNVNC